MCEDVGRGRRRSLFWHGGRKDRMGLRGEPGREYMHGLVPGLADAPSLRNKCTVHTLIHHATFHAHTYIRGSKGCSSSFVCPPQPSPTKLTSPRAARSSKGSSTFLSSEVAPALVAVADIFIGCRIVNAWAASGANRTAARSNTEARPASCIVVFWGGEAVGCVGGGEDKCPKITYRQDQAK